MTTAQTDPIRVDALIIGAGPVGLFAAFQFGLLGMRCAVVDALPFAGGQTVQLYAQKPIYDIPGIPVITGHALTQSLLQQVAPFGGTLHLGLQVASLSALPARPSPTAPPPAATPIAPTHVAEPPATPERPPLHPGYRLETTPSHLPSQAGPCFEARFVCITAGVGAFMPRPLPGLAPETLSPHEGRHLHWHFDAAQAHWTGPHTISGGGPEAVAAALALAEHASPQTPVTLIHRRDVLQADEADLARMAALRASGHVRVLAGQITALHAEPAPADAADQAALHHLSVAVPDGSTQTLPTAHLWVLQGLSPRLGPIADWGMALAKRQVAIDPATSGTSLVGVFAAGDVVSYAGKRRLIVSGFHEATQAAYAASDLLKGGETPVLYTTTSPVLHQRLGVKPEHTPLR